MNPPDEIPKLTPQQSKGVELIINRTVQLLADSQGWGKTCLGCSNFDEPSEICKKWNARPPARTIVEGCEAFEKSPF